MKNSSVGGVSSASPFFELFIKKQGQYFLCARSVFFVCWLFQTQKQIFLLYFAVLSHYYVKKSQNLAFYLLSVTNQRVDFYKKSRAEALLNVLNQK